MLALARLLAGDAPPAGRPRADAAGALVGRPQVAVVAVAGLADEIDPSYAHRPLSAW